MKPNAFEYFNPGTVAEAVKLLEQYGDEGKVLAGGQSLIPMLNFRVARPQYLIDINGLKDLDYIREEKGELVIGALTRERAVEKSALVQKLCPILPKAISYIGHVPIRTRGTIGGTLVHADPSAEIPVVATALGAKMKVAGPSGERRPGSRGILCDLSDLRPGTVRDPGRGPDSGDSAKDGLVLHGTQPALRGFRDRGRGRSGDP